MALHIKSEEMVSIRLLKVLPVKYEINIEEIMIFEPLAFVRNATTGVFP